MKISLITVSYNSVKTIRDTFESVLSQTYSDIEYVVVDGNSVDGTLNLIKEYEVKFAGRMHWVSEPDEGLYDAMNKGIRKASGDVIGIINSDDLFCDALAIEKVISIFEKETVDAVYADLYYVDQYDVSKIRRRWITGEQRPFRKGWHPAHPTLFLHKCVYEKYGLFDLGFKLAADFEIMLRFFDRYKIKAIYLPDFLIRMRLGGTTNNGIKNIYKQNIECIQAFKKNTLKVNSICYPIRRLLPKLLQYK